MTEMVLLGPLPWVVVGEDERSATYNPILVLGFDDDHRTAESVRTPLAGAVHKAASSPDFIFPLFVF